MSATKTNASFYLTLAVAVLAAIAIVIVVVMVGYPISTTSQNGKPHTQDGLLMDTYVKQTTYDTSENVSEKLIAVFEYLADFEQKASPYLNNSEIAEINHHAGVSPVTVSDEIFQMLARGKALCLESDGRFDITIGPLVTLWGVNGDNPKVPAQSEIEATKQRVDIKKLTLNAEQKTVKLNNPYMAIDTGGFAKGYACDLAREKYQEIGLTSCLLSLGGNIYSFGTKPDGSDFVIGLRDPLGTAEEIFATVTAPDKVISTTGGYERYFEQDGIRYHHVLDPKIGAPAQTDLLSVTVIAEEGIYADYLSTSLFIGGKQTIIQNLDQASFDLIAVDRDKNVYLSDGIKDRFHLAESTAYHLAKAEE